MSSFQLANYNKIRKQAKKEVYVSLFLNQLIVWELVTDLLNPFFRFDQGLTTSLCKSSTCIKKAMVSCDVTEEITFGTKLKNLIFAL